ncbi:secreted glycine rich protein, putative, partial [Ixodes scapularis]
FRTILIMALATCTFATYLGYGGYGSWVGAPLAHSSVSHHTPYFSYGYGQSVGHGYGLGYGLGYGYGLGGLGYGGFYKK